LSTFVLICVSVGRSDRGSDEGIYSEISWQIKPNPRPVIEKKIVDEARESERENYHMYDQWHGEGLKGRRKANKLQSDKSK
jgi:hypothetical protein